MHREPFDLACHSHTADAARTGPHGQLRNGNAPGDFTSAPRCGARTRRGTECQSPAVRGRRRCRMHGGWSTGPRTADGWRRSRAAVLKHGKYSAIEREVASVAAELTASLAQLAASSRDSFRVRERTGRGSRWQPLAGRPRTRIMSPERANASYPLARAADERAIAVPIERDAGRDVRRREDTRVRGKTGAGKRRPRRRTSDIGPDGR
jgi:hypothetical protein